MSRVLTDAEVDLQLGIIQYPFLPYGDQRAYERAIYRVAYHSALEGVGMKWTVEQLKERIKYYRDKLEEEWVEGKSTHWVCNKEEWLDLLDICNALEKRL